MSDRMKSLGIDRLSLEERVLLLQDIADSIAEEQTPLSDGEHTELERRIAANRANPDNVIPWEQIKAEALARFQK